MCSQGCYQVCHGGDAQNEGQDKCDNDPDAQPPHVLRVSGRLIVLRLDKIDYAEDEGHDSEELCYHQ